MKKLLSFIITAAAIISMSVTTFATEYNVNDKSVTVNTDGKRTVLISNSATNDIVYIGEAENEFDAMSTFLLKLDSNGSLPDGAYTIRFNGDATPTTFYVGMTNTGADVQLDLISGEGGSYATEDGKRNVGYMKSGVTGSFSGAIIKMNDQYYGKDLGGTILTVTNASIGLQINGVGDETIQEVWLTGRSFITE